MDSTSGLVSDTSSDSRLAPFSRCSTHAQDLSVLFPGLADDVVATLVEWRPAGWPVVDSALLDPVLPQVRRWVAAAAPPNVTVCRRMLSAVAAITLWGWHRFGSVDERLLWQSRNVEWWVMVFNADRSRHWRHNTRGVLRRVGRVVYPQGWPVVPRPAGRSSLPVPYTRRDQETFRVCGWYGTRRRPGGSHVGGGSLPGRRTLRFGTRGGCC